LNGGQFDTFYHEHVRTYSYKSFEYIADSLGMNVLDAEFVSRYGGDIRIYLGSGEVKNLDIDESNFARCFEKLNKHLLKWTAEKRIMINDYVKLNGSIRAKAFPGRAAILLKILDLDESHISSVYEISGSIKVQHYVPGTRIPILPERYLYLQDMSLPILNLAWHIPDEVRANLSSNGYTGQVIDIKDKHIPNESTLDYLKKVIK
jgi:hypothetical protein